MGTFLGDLTDLNAVAPKHPSLNGNDGFQEAHGIGANSLAKPHFEEFNAIAGFTLGDFNNAWNIVHVADTEAGSRAIGGGFHRGAHVIDYDLLSYDYDDVENSQKYLNVLERDTEDIILRLEDEQIDATPDRKIEIEGEIEAARVEMRAKTAAFSDLLSILNMDQSILDKYPEYGELKQLVYNKNNSIAGLNDATAVKAYLNSPEIQQFFEADNLNNNELLNKIIDLRMNGGDPLRDIGREIIELMPDASRVYYPDGEVLWDDDVRSDIFARQMFAHGNAGSKNAFLNAIESPEFDELRSLIKDDLTNNFAGNKPNDFFEYLRRATFNDIATDNIDAAKDRYVAIHQKASSIDPDLMDRVKAADGTNVWDKLAASINEIDSASELSGKHKAIGQVGAFELAFAAVSVHTRYKAQTVDDLEPMTFDDWLAHQAPAVLASLPVAATVGAGMLMLAYAGPVGWAAAIAINGVGLYAGVKSFLRDYITAYGAEENQPQFVEIATGILEGLEAFEALPVVNFVVEIVEIVAEQVLTPFFESMMPALNMGAGYQVLASGEDNAWMIGDEAASLIGNDAENKIFHFGAGMAFGGGGDDWLISYKPDLIKEGEYVDPNHRAQAAINESLPEDEQVPIDGVKAFQDHILRFEGGDGNDVLVVWEPDYKNSEVGGDPDPILMDGGEGDDWIFASTGNANFDIRGGAGNDLVFYLNSGDADAPKTYGEERKEVKVDAGTGDDWVIGLGAAEIKLGEGEDWLIAAGVGSVIYTGPGGAEDRDSINMLFTRGALAADVDAYDKIAMYGFWDLAGTYVKHRDSESNYTYGLFGAIKLSINSNGELVVGDIFSKDGEDETFLYVANYTNDPTANSADLTAGVRMGEFWLNIWQLLKGPGIDDDRSGEDTMWEFIRGAIKDISFRKDAGAVDPLVFDLDGDGLELTSMVTGVSPMFDMDGDGFAEHTGWVAPDDGMLALDANGNGTIDDVNELFGGAGQSGFDELALHDDNADGVIDATDAVFADLRIWRDLDGDAVTDDGELFTLAELNIASIDLEATEDGSQNALNIVDRTGSFTYGDGSTGAVGDVTFRINNYDTVYAGDNTIAADVVATMPNLKGHGTLADLQVSITLDGIEGALAQTINSILPTLNVIDLDILSDRAFDILNAWVDATPVNTSTGTYSGVPALISRVDGEIEVRDFAYQTTETITLSDNTEESVTYWKGAAGTTIRDADGLEIEYPTLDQVLAYQTGVEGISWEVVSAEKLAFMERYFGEEIPIYDVAGFTGSSVSAFSNLLETTERVAAQLTLRLAMQGGLEDYFDGVEYSVEDDRFRPTTDFELIPFFKKIFEAAPSEATAAQEWLDAWKPLVDALLSDYERPGAGQITAPFIFTNVVAAYEAIGLSISLADAAESLGVSKDFVDFGSGIRTGTNDQEIFYMSSGDDVVESKSGSDVFVFGENFGQDVINDFEQTNDNFDTIRFAHLTPDDIVATRDGKNLILTVTETGDSVTVIGQFHVINFTSFGGSSGPYQGIEEIVFANGDVWGASEIAKAVSHPLDSDDTLIGTDHFDVLDGGLGDDYLQGGNNFDLYRFDAGYGSDIIQDRQMNVGSIGQDVVMFGDGLTRADLSFFRDGDSNDLVINTTSGDSLTVKGQFGGGSALGMEFWVDRIESFQFEKNDGESLGFDHADVMRTLVNQAKTDGDDTIYGFTFDDVLDGGAGNDTLVGGNKNDTYKFGFGYGSDIFDEGIALDLNFETIDKVLFGPGVTQSDLTLERIENSADLTVNLSDGSQFTIKRQFLGDNIGGNHHFAIETFEFEDGSSWDQEQIYDKMLESTSGDDNLYGFFRNDVLDGGAGNDYLNGGDGDDTYVFDYGYGQDVIYDEMVSIFTNDHDRLRFGASVLEDDVTWSRDGDSNSLVATLSDGSQLTIQSQFSYNNFGHRFFDIEHFEFGDGQETTIWDVQRQLIQGTDGDDVLYGFASEDVFDGGAGNDTYYGDEYADTYHFGYGYGHDRINDFAPSAFINGNDKIVFGEGISASEIQVAWTGNSGLDLSLTVATGETITIENYRSNIYSFSFNTVEEVHFADGTVWTTPELMARYVEGAVTSADDDIRGFGELGGEIWSGAGNDTISGFNGDNTFAGGAGDDLIIGGTGDDTYLYSIGDGSDIIKERWDYGNDTLVFGASIESTDVQVLRDLTDLEAVTLKFADGSEIKLDEQISTFDAAGIENFIFDDGTTWTAEDLRQKYVQGNLTDEDDYFVGFTTSDVIAGGAGDDELHGGWGNDTLEGGVGSDHLIGGRDVDTYVFTRGDGVDLIDDSGYANQADKLVLHGYTPDELIIGQPEGTTDIAITFVGTSDRITLRDNANSGTTDEIEQIVFDNGAIWEIAHVRDLIDGVIDTDGDDVVWGTNGADTLTGGLGDDHLRGGAGSDTYVYTRGDGHDQVTEYQSGIADLDQLVLVGIASDAVSVSRSGDTVVLTIAESAEGAGDAGSITLDFNLLGVSGAGVEEIVFDDGTIWTGKDLRARLVTLAGTATVDDLTGTSSTDIVAGGLGDDVLQGGNGGDIYLYARGDGHDTIDEARLANGDDTLRLEEISTSDVSLEREGNDVRLVISESTAGAGDGGSILLDESLNEDYDEGIEQVIFDDGTLWTRADLRAKLLESARTDGNDTIVGFNTSDIINGGAGDDQLEGGDRGDTYIYYRGDGHDTIDEARLQSGDDILRLEDINPNEVTLERDGNDVRILIAESLAGTGDNGSILIDESLDADYDEGIEQVVFADGTVWTRADLRVKLIEAAQTDGNDTVVGFNTADVIEGGLGDDVLEGASGGDTYVYARGDGHDTIDEDRLHSGEDTLQLEGINPNEVTLVREGNDVRVIISESTAGAGDSGSILISESLDEDYDEGIERITFADGTSWTRSELRVKLIEQAQSGGNDTVVGFNVADTFEGGLGDDFLEGASGGDTYIYRRGDGHDTIEEVRFGSGDDTLRLEDINPGEVSLERNGNDVRIVIAESAAGAGDGGSVLLVESLDEDFDEGVEQIVFVDGTIWSRADLRLMLLDASQTDGNDTIIGFSTSDVIEGGLGDDFIQGLGGSDTYVFNRGDGNDVIEDNGALSTDKLLIKGYVPSELTLTRSSSSDDLIITFSGSSDRIGK